MTKSDLILVITLSTGLEFAWCFVRGFIRGWRRG